MAAKLPTLIANNRTRTGNEVSIWYNLGLSVVLGQIVITATNTASFTAESSCSGDNETCEASGFVALRAAKPNGNASASVSVNGTAVTFPANSPVGASFEVVDIVSPVSTVAVTGGTVGDAYDVVCLPPTQNDVLICFDQGFNANVGATQRAIPRKLNPVDHYVDQRAENTLSLGELMVSNWKGLRRINGRNVTLVVKITPGGAGAQSEIQYYTKARLSVPMTVPAEGNDSVVTNGEGSFNKNLFFAAP